MLLTRVGAAVVTRDLRDIRAQLAQASIPVFETQIAERAAYRAIFSFGGSLHTLDPEQVSNIKTAILNARAFAAEVVALLQKPSHASDAKEVSRDHAKIPRQHL